MGAPPGLERVSRLVEIIDADPARRQAGRERFKQYRAMGVEPVTHKQSGSGS
jgi:DNA polymerase-3 subunit chi